jgi:hypothetical protein
VLAQDARDLINLLFNTTGEKRSKNYLLNGSFQNTAVLSIVNSQHCRVMETAIIDVR